MTVEAWLEAAIAMPSAHGVLPIHDEADITVVVRSGRCS